MRTSTCLRLPAALLTAGAAGLLTLTAAIVPAGPAGAAGAAVAHSRPVSHFNVGATHSPRLLRQLAGPTRTGRQSAGPAKLPGAVQGIDVAAFQHPNGAAINWTRVAASGIQFASVKATEGTYYQNPYALADLAAAKAAGLSVFAYIFAIPDGDGGSASPKAQADYLLSYLGSAGRSTPIMLDIEYNPYGAECYGLRGPGMVSWINQFDAAVQARTGRLPVIYTPPQWWDTCTGGSAAAGQTPLWVPDYTTGSSPVLPAGWNRWAFWQYSSSGTVPGIASGKDIDLDQLHPARIPLLDPGSQLGLTGAAVSLRVTPADPGAAGSPAFTAAGLPPGLGITATGRIKGRPARAGAYRVTVHAAKGGSTGAVRFSWTVRTP